MKPNYTAQYTTAICKAISATQGFNEDRTSEWLGPMVHTVDIELTRLRAINADLLAALTEVVSAIRIEHSLRPDYGWQEWLDEYILPAIEKAKGQA
jgi:hypothetical protein